MANQVGNLLQAVSWLRKKWAQGRDVLLADEKGLGRTATVITLLQSLRYCLV